MILRSMLVRQTSHLPHQNTLHNLFPSYENILRRLVPNLKIEEFCTAGGDTSETMDDVSSATGKANNSTDDAKNARLRRKMDELRKLKQQMDDLDKEFDSFFTVDYALQLAKKGFEDSDDDKFEDSSESERPDLEIEGPSKDELSPNEDDSNADDNDDDDDDDDDDVEDDDDDDDDDDDEDEDDDDGDYKAV